LSRRFAIADDDWNVLESETPEFMSSLVNLAKQCTSYNHYDRLVSGDVVDWLQDFLDSMVDDEIGLPVMKEVAGEFSIIADIDGVDDEYEDYLSGTELNNDSRNAAPNSSMRLFPKVSSQSSLDNGGMNDDDSDYGEMLLSHTTLGDFNLALDELSGSLSPKSSTTGSMVPTHVHVNAHSHAMVRSNASLNVFSPPKLSSAAASAASNYGSAGNVLASGLPPAPETTLQPGRPSSYLSTLFNMSAAGQLQDEGCKMSLQRRISAPIRSNYSIEAGDLEGSTDGDSQMHKSQSLPVSPWDQVDASVG
jgi:hypothetical protein